MATLKQMIAFAEAEIGYHEKATNRNLDQKTASNDGNGNYTKYARDLNAAGFFNGNKNGYDWCSVFITWLAYQACANKKDALALLCQTGDLGAGCTYARGYYKDQGRLYDTAEVGDQAFFSSSQSSDPSNADHTALVVAVDGNAVTVIEGNWSQQVAKNTYHYGDGWLYCFGRPKYENASTEPVVEPAEETPAEEGTVTYTVQAGDTLWDIGQKFGVDYKVIAQQNGISDPSLIHVGDVLTISGGTVTSETTSELKVGDKVKVTQNAPVYGETYHYAMWVYSAEMYIRELDGDRAVISTTTTGAITGPVDKQYLTKI